MLMSTETVIFVATAEINYLENILKYINEGEPEMGFEKIVEGMRRARPEIAPQIEERYKKVLYNFNK